MGRQSADVAGERCECAAADGAGGLDDSLAGSAGLAAGAAGWCQSGLVAEGPNVAGLALSADGVEGAGGVEGDEETAAGVAEGAGN